MEPRMNHKSANPDALKAMLAFEQAARGSGIDGKLYELIKLRASQLNGCSFCIDMHAKDMLNQGESLDRILLLATWREVPLYTERERAVLELTEYATKVSENGVPREVYDRVRAHFDEKQFVDLILAINAINAWNRLSLATGMFPGCFN